MHTCKRAIKGVVFFLIFVLLIGKAEYVFRDKTNAAQYRPFFDEKINYDVYIIGTSVAVGGGISIRFVA